MNKGITLEFLDRQTDGQTDSNKYITGHYSHWCVYVFRWCFLQYEINV